MQKSNLTATETSDSRVNPEANNVAIGGRMRAWRRSMRWSQQELADRMSVNKATLRRYELGLNSPNTTHLALLYHHGVNMNWLLTGEGSMLREAPVSLPSDNPVEKRINKLAEAMRVLRERSPEKYELLSMGFIERCREALHLAILEEQLGKRDALSDIVRANATYKQPPLPQNNADIISAPFPGEMGKED